jgi:hypothetical protein
MGDDVKFQINEQDWLRLMEQDLAGLDMTGAAIHAQFAEIATAGAQAIDQFGEALRQLNEAIMTKYILWQGNYSDPINAPSKTMVYDTLAEAEAAIYLHYALICKTDHYPLLASDPIPFPVYVYQSGELVRTLHNDQDWRDWQTGH